MLANFYIPRPSNDMKIAVQKNHLGGQMLYKSFYPSKKRRQCISWTGHKNLLFAKFLFNGLSEHLWAKWFNFILITFELFEIFILQWSLTEKKGKKFFKKITKKVKNLQNKKKSEKLFC